MWFIFQQRNDSENLQILYEIIVTWNMNENAS